MVLKYIPSLFLYRKHNVKMIFIWNLNKAFAVDYVYSVDVYRVDVYPVDSEDVDVYLSQCLIF